MPIVLCSFLNRSNSSPEKIKAVPLLSDILSPAYVFSPMPVANLTSIVLIFFRASKGAVFFINDFISNALSNASAGLIIST